MFDKYGFIVNKDLKSGQICDYGDSTFFMGLQALNYILSGQISKAKKLYELCRQIDFLRHPLVLDSNNSYYKSKNQTSYDMLLIWDWLCSRYNKLFPNEPEYHYRNSKFFWGKHRNKLMYNFMIGTIVLLTFIPIFILFKKYFLKKFHKVHLMMLYFATVYEKKILDLIKKHSKCGEFIKKCKKINNYLKLARFLIKLIEKSLNYEHHFFRFLFYMKYENLNPIPRHNQAEWIYQRNLNHLPEQRIDKEFHYIKFNKRKLDLSEQFYEFAIKKALNLNNLLDK